MSTNQRELHVPSYTSHIIFPLLCQSSLCYSQITLMALTLPQLFQLALEKNASDLHLATNLPPVLRIDGVLQTQIDLPIMQSKDIQNLAFSILSEEQKRRYVESRELDTGYEIEDGTRFRVNLHWERDNAGMVARVIPIKVPTLPELTMPDIVYKILRMDQGLILLTGPTGCGKSTSLAAMINYINENRSCHIMTLEDPIEFVYKPRKSIIKQRQLGTDMLSFNEGLKHVVRQDPNVILVGEMRDLETIASTITLAETGHLVLATLHTFNAAQTVDRIIDVFPPHQQNQVRMQLSMFLRAVISQRLLPGAKGGRIAAREVLMNTPAIGNLIRENKIPQIRTTIQTSAGEGMFTMDQDIKRLLDANEITEATALAHAAPNENFSLN